MKFVGNVSRNENLIEHACAALESKIVFRAAVEVNFQPGHMRRTCESEWITTLPEKGIGWRAKDAQ